MFYSSCKISFVLSYGLIGPTFCYCLWFSLFLFTLSDIPYLCSAALDCISITKWTNKQWCNRIVWTTAVKRGEIDEQCLLCCAMQICRFSIGNNKRFSHWFASGPSLARLFADLVTAAISCCCCADEFLTNDLWEFSSLT